MMTYIVLLSWNAMMQQGHDIQSLHRIKTRGRLVVMLSMNIGIHLVFLGNQCFKALTRIKHNAIVYKSRL